MVDPLGYSELMDPAMLKQQIDSGEYRVDPRAVADAILRRVTQNECSYPDNGRSASRNATSGAPSTTDPIQVNPLLDGRSA